MGSHAHVGTQLKVSGLMPTVYFSRYYSQSRSACCDGVSATQEDDRFPSSGNVFNVLAEATNRKEEMVICGQHRWSNTVNTVITPANKSYKTLLCEHSIPQAVGDLVFGL